MLEPELDEDEVVLLEALESFNSDAGFEDDEDSEPEDELGPLAEDVEERESVMYQPLPLNTMPTG